MPISWGRRQKPARAAETAIGGWYRARPLETPSATLEPPHGPCSVCGYPRFAGDVVHVLYAGPRTAGTRVWWCHDICPVPEDAA